MPGSAPALTALTAALILALAATAGGAEEPLYPGIRTVFEGSETVVGETIDLPAEGAGVNASVVTLAPGETTGWHRHGTPLFAYLLEGEIEVEYAGHGTRRYAAGEGLLEAMAVAHRARNRGDGPVRILAVYITGDGREPAIPAPPPAD